MKSFIFLLVFTTSVFGDGYIVYVSTNSDKEYANNNFHNLKNYLEKDGYSNYKALLEKRNDFYLLKVVDLTKEEAVEFLAFIKKYYHDAFYKKAESKKVALPINKTKNIVDFTQNIEAVELFTKSVSYYNQNNYELAYKSLSELFVKYPSNIKINFYFGRSARLLEKHEEAYAAFERIIIQNEQHHRARLEMARTLFILKSYDNAKIEFEKVLQYPIPQQVRANIQKYVDAIDSGQKSYFLNGAFAVGLGWDDNVNNNTYVSQTPYGNLLLENDTNKKSDTHHKEMLTANLIIPYAKDSRFGSENNFLLYNQKQTKYDSKNIVMLSVSSALIFVQNNYKLSLVLSGDKLWYGSESLMHTYSIIPKINYKASNDILLDASIKYQAKRMSKEIDKDKDSSVVNVDFNVNKVLAKYEILSARLLYGRERKERGDRADVSKDSYGVTFSYSKQFFNALNTTFSYQYGLHSYIGSTAYLPKREDKNHVASMAVTYKISDKLLISTNFARTFTNSNIASFTYVKNVASFMLIKTF